MNEVRMLIIFIIVALFQLFLFYLIHYNRRQSIGYFTECLSRLSIIEDELINIKKLSSRIDSDRLRIGRIVKSTKATDYALEELFSTVQKIDKKPHKCDASVRLDQVKMEIGQDIRAYVEKIKTEAASIKKSFEDFKKMSSNKEK